MRYLAVVVLLISSVVLAVAGGDEVAQYIGYKYFPYTPHLGCNPGKPQSNAVLVQAEEFWNVMCSSTKAGEKNLPPAAQTTAQLLLDSILQVPESEKLGAEAQYLLGRFWLLNGSLAEATTTIMDAMVSDPNSPEYASALAVTFDRLFKTLDSDGQRQEMGIQVANQMAQRLLTMTTPKPEDYLMTARVYYMSDVPSSAISILDSGTMLYPKSSLLELAKVLPTLRMNDANSAALYLKKSIGLPAEYDSLQQYLTGVTTWRLGRLDIATEALSLVIKKDRRQNDAKRLLKHIRASVQ